MSHIAAIVPEAKAPFQFQEVQTAQPGPHEILIKNEAIGLIPIDAKLAKLAIFPIPYPAILGSAYGGTVTAVGAEVSRFKVGDKVVAAKVIAPPGDDKYKVFQEYIVAPDITAGKVTSDADLDVAVNLVGNLSTVISLINVVLGLDRPDPVADASAKKGKKILVYGGTSSFGSLTVQYLSQAGYDVVTTTSPKHNDLVAKLGAVKVIDHTQDRDDLLKALIAEGPYDFVIDSISLPNTADITAGVVAAQGGDKLWALLPPFGPETLPGGVVRDYRPWQSVLSEEENQELLAWAFNTYLPQAVANGRLVPLPTKVFTGGLKGLPEAVNVLIQGVSGTKVIVKFDA